MNKFLFTAASAATVALFAVTVPGCSSGLSQPFAAMKSQPIAVYHLNYVTQQPAAQPAGGLPVPVPPQIQTFLSGMGSMLPPGLLPPGILPGSAPAQPATQQFHNSPILRTAAICARFMRDAFR